MFDQSVLDRVNSLEGTPTGPELVAALAEIDLAALDGHQRVDVWRAEQRLIAHYQARSYGSMLSVQRQFMAEGDDEIEAFEGASAELQMAGSLTRYAADGELALAAALWWRLPNVGRALLGGEIDIRRAREFTHGTEHIKDVDARAIADELLHIAPELTTSQLKARIRRRCIKLNPDDATDRYNNSVEDRKVVSGLSENGTANLSIVDADPHQVAAASRNVNWLARSLKQAGDKRPMDRIRADVALDLLRGVTKDGKAGGGAIMHIDLETLTRLNNDAGELAGYGPVIADIARQTIEQQLDRPWEYIVTDPATERVISTGTTQRRPTASQSRYAMAQHATCIHPGCRMPAQDCDLDHRIAWAERRLTDATDLAPACRYHHRVKHAHNWTYQHLNNGQTEYTTRLGHKYTRRSRPPPFGVG